MAKNEKWKVFLCYARESQSLMDDFCDRFKDYNERDMEILYDRNAASGNMHEIFHRFATECDVAVLLVNARLVNPGSYANQYEVPVLLERQRAGEVILVGVRFSNVSDLEEWNAEGDIYFFSVTNSDLPYTRDKKRDDQVYLRKFAVYRQVDENDRDDFHDRLRMWIKECIRKRKQVDAGNGIAIPSSSDSILRDPRIIEQKLSDMKPNSLLFNLEKRLSEDTSWWAEADISLPGENASWAFWYCLRQADKYQEIQDALCKLTPEDPLKKLYDQFSKIEKRNTAIRRLMEDVVSDDEDSHDLEKCLSRVDRVLEKSTEKIIASPRRNHTEAKSELFDAVEALREMLKTIGGSSLGGS